MVRGITVAPARPSLDGVSCDLRQAEVRKGEGGRLVATVAGGWRRAATRRVREVSVRPVARGARARHRIRGASPTPLTAGGLEIPRVRSDAGVSQQPLLHPMGSGLRELLYDAQVARHPEEI